MKPKGPMFTPKNQSVYKGNNNARNLLYNNQEERKNKKSMKTSHRANIKLDKEKHLVYVNQMQCVLL